LLLPTDLRLRRLSEPVVLVDAALARAAQSLRNEADATDAAAPLVAEALATLISTLVVHNAPIVERGAARWIGQVREQIEAAADEVPTLGQLATEVGRSPAHVAATFQRTYGASVGTYARRLRLWRARDRLVSHPQQGLAQVALECGYADQSHFTRHFRQMFGLGPGAYRARQCATFGLSAAAL
jgi:AraC family transcriptional regulator